MDYIKRFFGLSEERQQFRSQRFSNTNDDIERPRFHSDGQRPNFNIFSDPLQMQRYFEHEMNEMLKLFGFQEFDNGFPNFFNNNPALEGKSEFNEPENYSRDLRDKFLKDGYEKPSQKSFEKVDKDIDGRVLHGNLESIFGRKDNRAYEGSPEGFCFGQSQNIKTIRHPDGSVETHRTLRDNKGNEETTICHKIGDKEYCVTKKRDQHGKEEIIENLVNMNDEEKKTLLKSKDNLGPVKGQPHNDFSFDEFFK